MLPEQQDATADPATFPGVGPPHTSNTPYASAALLCMPLSMLGRACLSLCCAVLLMGPPGWPVSMLEKLGLSDLLAKWPQKVLPLAAPVGHLKARWVVVVVVRSVGMLPP